MPQLFESSFVKSLELKNRAIRSATWSAVGDDKGFVTNRAVELYSHLAAGGLGLIITGFQYVLPNGVAMPYQMGNYDDAQTEGLRRLAAAIRSNGCRVVAQIVHTGAKANPSLFPEQGELWGPSAIPDPQTGNTPREVTPPEIRLLVDAYAAAARRCKEAGFDGVQLHCAHGYGINQFLSPAANRRGDEYGGDRAGRYRFLGETLEAVRGAMGTDYPVMVKLSGNDHLEGGMTPEDALYVARRLEEDGIDAIEMSAGSRGAGERYMPSRLSILRQEQEAYLLDLAAACKQTVKVPVVTVGGIRSPDVINRILSDNKADYVALCRPFIREPHLINRWKSGDQAKARCISCNQCFGTADQGRGIFCAVEAKELERTTP
jgi:2,4-dienoyl-CoA reductase-like NADH-dependent reductase (Old Yellow Enzyme family)